MDELYLNDEICLICVLQNKSINEFCTSNFIISTSDDKNMFYDLKSTKDILLLKESISDKYKTAVVYAINIKEYNTLYNEFISSDIICIDNKYLYYLCDLVNKNIYYNDNFYMTNVNCKK